MYMHENMDVPVATETGTFLIYKYLMGIPGIDDHHCRLV